MCFCYYEIGETEMSSTSSAPTINLSSIGTALNDIFNVIVQYLPVIATVIVVFGIIQYLTGGISGLFSGLSGIFG